MRRHLISSDRTIQAMKPGVKRLNDGAGLHLRQRDGNKHWYQDFSFNGVRWSLSLGAYPDVGLAEARRRSHEMRADVALGINPGEKRKAQAKAERERQAARHLLGRQDAQPGSFEYLARVWIKVRAYAWSEQYSASVVERLEKHVFPLIGQRPISSIHRSEFTQLLMGIDNAGTTSTAKRVHALCRRVCDFAVATGYLESNACPEVRETLRTVITRHHPAITDPKKLEHFLRAVAAYQGTFGVICAIKLAMKTFLRSAEFRWARWSEIDFDRHLWTVPADRMKGTKEEKLNREDHLVPLSRQAIDILMLLRQITGDQPFVFAGQGWKNPVISENTLNQAIRKMGYSTHRDQTLHGLRATARTILVERLGWHTDIVELQLDHKVRDANGAAYNRTQFAESRFEMMQEWSDYLDQLQAAFIPKSVQHHSRPSDQGRGEQPGTTEIPPPQDNGACDHEINTPTTTDWPTASAQAISVLTPSAPPVRQDPIITSRGI